jgi:adenosine deaminase
MTTPLRDFIRALPKTETHLHIEGALPWELLCETRPDKYSTPPASWAPDFRFASFAHFEGELLGYAGDFFTSAERYHACAKAVFESHLRRNVRYVETSFASGCIDFMNLDGREVCDAIRAAVPEGLEVRIFLGIHHDGCTEKMAPVLESALHWGNLDGIDLHGAENTPLGDWAPDFWRRAREAGKFTKAHAGEFCGAWFVRDVIEKLGAQRIQHGVRALEDPELVSMLRDNGIALDVCPISNVKLRVVPSAREHPIKKLVEAGVVCTVSTDDPISFGNTIEDEYEFLARELHFNESSLAQIAQNGFRVALPGRRTEV